MHVLFQKLILHLLFFSNNNNGRNKHDKKNDK